ncbi:glutathione S-transferase family protein [Alphaproteobacteria bacterium]|nr:glutathione S-transferase family protein [bacterium]MDC0147366.1 glutathione S-transferase family protein [Alphaproteobacteria bacterium]
MQILGAPLSPFVKKVRIVAAEKNIDYDYDPRPSPLGWPEGFERINPLKRIPALLPDPENPDFAINDSSPICAYLDRLSPEPALYPAAAEAYGRALWIEEFCDGDLAAKVGLGVFRPVFFNLAMGKPADYEAAKAGFKIVEDPYLTYLEAQIGEHDWFAGDAFSIADIAVTVQVYNLSFVGFDLPAARFPKLAAHFARCAARPSVAGLVADDKAFVAKAGLALPKQAI